MSEKINACFEMSIWYWLDNEQNHNPAVLPRGDVVTVTFPDGTPIRFNVLDSTRTFDVCELHLEMQKDQSLVIQGLDGMVQRLDVEGGGE